MVNIQLITHSVHTHTHKHTYKHTHTLSHTLSLPHTLSHEHTHAHTHTHTRTHAHTHTHKHTHTHTHITPSPSTHTHSQTHTLRENGGAQTVTGLEETAPSTYPPPTAPAAIMKEEDKEDTARARVLEHSLAKTSHTTKGSVDRVCGLCMGGEVVVRQKKVGKGV